MRKTRSLIQVAAVLLSEPDARHWGYDLIKRSGERSAVVYPMLTKMLDEGWVVDGWEDPATITEKRPPRRYYELTESGKRELGATLRAARSDWRFSALELGWA
ncbi:PadR family transcriptional regulator [Nocardia nova]|jgi:PadR family transcriptional regulator PadR|uniref:PadR family transcriptional regulator n=1 Tax=Nocardia nova TaxID=37330 RepID=UPI0007A52D79|nr:helix-turn-helix transcriptional regulator [Nocardia nova]